MAKTYTQDNYHFKINRGILKNGNDIYDEDGKAVFAIKKSADEDTTDLILDYSKNPLGMEHKNYRDMKLDDSEFAKILTLARKYALEHDQSLFVVGSIKRKYDIQNFIHNNDDLHVPMSNHEILKLNDNGITPQVKLLNPRYTHGEVSNIYIVSTGKIKLDVNSDLYGYTHNSVILRNRDNDFSNITNISDDGVDKNRTRLIFNFVPDSENTSYTFPEKIDKGIEAQIPLQIKKIKITGAVRYVHYIPEFETNHKNISIKEEFPNQFIKRTRETIECLTTECRYKDIPSDNEELKAVDRFLKLNDTHPYMFHKDDEYEVTLEDIKNARNSLNLKELEHAPNSDFFIQKFF